MMIQWVHYYKVDFDVVMVVTTTSDVSLYHTVVVTNIDVMVMVIYLYMVVVMLLLLLFLYSNTLVSSNYQQPMVVVLI